MNKIDRPKQRNRPVSLYPLKFQEVIADVLKTKPEPKPHRPKVHRAKSQKTTAKRK